MQRYGSVPLVAPLSEENFILHQPAHSRLFSRDQQSPSQSISVQGFVTAEQTYCHTVHDYGITKQKMIKTMLIFSTCAESNLCDPT